MTTKDLKDKLAQLDEISVMELLDLSSEDIVDRFEDKIQSRADYLEAELYDEYEDYLWEDEAEESLS
jgi:hypothetical protein